MKKIHKRRATTFTIILLNILLIPSISQIITKYIPKDGLNIDFKLKLSAPPIIVTNQPYSYSSQSQLAAKSPKSVKSIRPLRLISSASGTS